MGLSKKSNFLLDRAPQKSVNASTPPSRAAPHDSAPMWDATPLSYDFFIHYNLAGLTGAQEKRNENQSDQRTRGRPGQGPALLYGGTGLCQEDGFQPGPVSLADRGLARGAGRH